MPSVITTRDLIAVLAAFLTIYVLQWLVRRWMRYRGYNLPPGPSGWPLLGHVGTVPHTELFTHRDLYGDVSYVNVVGTDIIVLNSLAVIREALQGPTAEVFSGRPATFIKDYFIDDDIIFRSMDADKWKPLRQMFHSLLKQYGEGIKELEETVTRELEVVVQKLDSRVGEQINIDEYLSPSLVNILCILSIGERFDYDHDNVQINIKSLIYGNRLANPFIDMILRTFPPLKYIPLGLGAIVKGAKTAQMFCLNYLFEEPKALPEGESIGRTGIVYEMLRKQKVVPWVSDDKIKGVLQNIFGAGFLTSSSSLKAFFLIMLHHPDVQARIQSEIDDIIGDDRRPALSDRSSMPYTTAAILELSRYASVLPASIPHACSKQTDFRGYTVPRDAIILPNLFRVHHDSEFWENPWEFNPSRFLDDSGQLRPATDPTRQHLIPFGVGKRVCMGEVFAKTRLFLYITSILQRFTLQPADYLPSCDSRDMVPELVMAPVPYELTFVRREY